MRSPGDLDIVTGTGPAGRPAAVSTRCPNDRHDPWLRTGPNDVKTVRPTGQPGHGRTAYLRRQPARIVDGRFEGGYTDVYELICPACGDHPYLDYCEVSPRHQWLRGPRTLEEGLAAYHEHLGIAWQSTTEPGASGPGRGLRTSDRSPNRSPI